MKKFFSIKMESINLFVLTIFYISFMIDYVLPQFQIGILNSRVALLLQISCVLYFILNYFRLIISKNNEQTYLRTSTPSRILLVSLWIIFSILMIISKIYNDESILGGIGYLLFVPIIYFTAIPGSLENPIITIMKASMNSGIFFLLLSLIFNPNLIGMGAYLGVFPNPNNIGLLAMQVGISSICLLFYYVIKKIPFKKIKLITYGAIFVFSLIFLFASQSRTSFVALFFAIGMVLIITVFKGKLKIRYLLLIATIAIVVYIAFLQDYFISGIAQKFTSRSSINLLSGREIIWSEIIDEAKIFGYGTEYFNNNFGIGGHNSILEYIGTNGMIVGIILLMFFLWAIICAIFYIKKNDEDESFIPFVFITSYVAANTVESYFGLVATPFTIIFYNLIGILVLNLSKREYK